MSAYDNDPRVVWDGSGFSITVYPGREGSPVGRVTPSESGDWEAFGLIGGGDYVRDFHDTADEAIRQLIGHPE